MDNDNDSIMDIETGAFQDLSNDDEPGGSGDNDNGIERNAVEIARGRRWPAAGDGAIGKRK